MHPSNGILYLATDADPGSILRVRPELIGRRQNSEVWARSMPRRAS